MFMIMSDLEMNNVRGDMNVMRGNVNDVAVMRLAELQSGDVGVCHNVEYVGACAGMLPVRRGVRVCDGEVMPLWHVTAGEYVCLYHNCLSVIDMDAGLVRSLMVLEGVMPLSGVYRDNWLRVWFEDGSERLWCRVGELLYEARDEGFYGGRERFAVFEVVAGRRTEYVADIAGCTLKGVYGHGSVGVCAADREALKRDLFGAYDEIYGRARAEGYFVQPVIVRYRLEDESGETVYVSQPKVVGCETGFQGLSGVEMRSSDGLITRGSGQLRMEGYKLAVRCCDDVSGIEGVARLVVEVSEELDAADRDWGVVCSVSHGVAGGEATIVVRPARRSVTEAVCAGVRKMVNDGGAKVAEFVLSTPGLPDDDGEGYAEAWPNGTASHPMRVVAGRYGLPNCFVPLRLCAEGEAVPVTGAGVLAGLPGSVAWLGVCRRGGSGSWRGYVSVTLSGGRERVVEAMSGSGAAPELFSPLWMYGSSDAMSMTVCVTSGGVTRRRVVSLRSVPGLDAAVWMSESGGAVRLDEEVEVFALPSMTRQLQMERSALVSVRIGDRGRLTVADVRHGIESIAGAEATGFTRTGSVWSRMTSRFVLSGRGGTLMASIASDGRLTGVRMLSDTGLRSLCRLGNGRVFGLTGRNELAEVCEREVKLTGLCVEGARECAADRGSERVVIADDSGVLWEYDPSRGRYHTRDVNGEGCVHVSEVASSGCVAACCAGGVYRLDGERAGQYVRCTSVSERAGELTEAIEADLSGCDFEGSLSAGVSQGSRGLFASVGRVTIKGECMRSVRVWMPLMRCKRVMLTVTGMIKAVVNQ